jgi:two-component system sensor histidine kinase CpxA
MRSLLVRIFVSFWLIIGITIGVAAVAGYYYAERVRSEMESFEFDDAVLEASAALSSGGREGLVTWLRETPPTRKVTIYILDEDGRDIIGRELPRYLSRKLHHHQFNLPHRARQDPSNLRRARPLSQLVSGDGEIYTVLLSRPHRAHGYWEGAPAGSLLLVLALIVSGIVSYLLARAISNPVRQLRHATVSLAEGNMHSRVASSVGNRRDELGMLARDFDAMAEKLQRAAAQQTELSRNISHELRSPLARLRVAMELARRKTGELQEFDRIDDETERLDRLIGQILSYTRLEAGSQSVPAPVDLADLVQEVVENVNFECRAEGYDGVSVEAEIKGSPVVTGYPEALTSAVENIVRNAVRHSPPNRKVIVRVADTPGNAAIVEVMDDGEGVADQELPHLFQPFFRTRSAAADSRKRGTGLGLAIAERAVKLNAGTVTAANRPSGGLSVTIRLPSEGRGFEGQ